MDNNWIALTACVMVEQKNKCAMCGKELEDNEFTLHHIKPRAKGGKDELDNLIGLCNMCHDTAEYKHFNREEIINCRYNSYPRKKQNKYIKILIPIIDNEIEYKYPEEIILQGMHDIIKSGKTIIVFEVDKEFKDRIIEACKNFKIDGVPFQLTLSQFVRMAVDRLLNEIRG